MRRYNPLLIALSWLFLGLPLRALAQSDLPAARAQYAPRSICPIIDSVARANGLPVDFFIRVIWQESRFQPNAVGPLTHTGEHALGIAQFMPSTAVARGLFEPLNPVVALPKSGEFLAELRKEFGNLGLAAAAYNAGSERVHEFIVSAHDLPVETRDYVQAITGRTVDDWAKHLNQNFDAADKKQTQVNAGASDCPDILALLEQGANSSMTEARNVPGWCRHLNHPNTSVCGAVHEQPTMEASSIVTPKGHVFLPRSSPTK
jgi:hypothetical protein